MSFFRGVFSKNEKPKKDDEQPLLSKHSSLLEEIELRPYAEQQKLLTEHMENRLTQQENNLAHLKKYLETLAKNSLINTFELFEQHNRNLQVESKNLKEEEINHLRSLHDLVSRIQKYINEIETYLKNKKIIPQDEKPKERYNTLKNSYNKLTLQTQHKTFTVEKLNSKLAEYHTFSKTDDDSLVTSKTYRLLPSLSSALCLTLAENMDWFYSLSPLVA